MNAAHLLEELTSAGVSLQADGAQLRIRAPKGTLTDAIREQLASHKEQLLDHLHRRDLRQGVGVPPLGPAARGPHLPLSYSQQGLWLLDQVEGGGPSYNLIEALRLSGPLDREVLELSVHEVVRRHESLRTSFPRVDGAPVQRIAPPSDTILIQEIELSGSAKACEQIQAWAQAEVEVPFDLTTGPLLRLYLIRLAPDYHVLAIAMHHIICDAQSLFRFVDELSQLYGAFSQERPSPLCEPPVQYADVAQWQRYWLDEPALEAQREYWKHQLADAPDLLDLPTDYPRPLIQSSHGAVERFHIDAEVIARLKQMSQGQGATLYMSLLAALAALLARYSGHDDLCIGSALSNRKHQETEELIGFFINTLVLRARPQLDQSFESLLAALRQTALDAYAHQDLPFEQIVQDLQPERSASYTPLIQVMFVLLQGSSATSRQAGDLRIERFELDGVTAKFDLMFTFEEADGALRSRIEYRTVLFRPSTVQRMVAQFERVVRSVAEDPTLPIGRLPLHCDGEQAMLQAWSRAERSEAPAAQSVHELFLDQVERSPHADAIEQGLRRLSYLELSQRASQLAHYLRERGVERGDTVALCCERSLVMAIGLLGILKAGAAYMPLDADYPSERLGHMLRLGSSKLVLTQSSVRDRLPEAAEGVLCLDTEWQAIAACSMEDLTTANTPADLAYVLFTSGSTGEPKGVAMPHRSLTGLIDWHRARESFAPGRRTLQFAPLSFDVSFQELLTTWCTGGCVVLMEGDERRDPGALLRRIEQAQVTRLFLPFVALEQLARTAQSSGRYPEGVREVYVAGEQLRITPAVAELFRRLEPCALHNHYGPTETHVVTTYQLPEHPDDWPLLPPIGEPVPGARIHVLDAALAPVPIGVAGELYVGGDVLAQGYLQREDLTRERFIDDPFCDEPGTRLYRTGDLARWRSDGNLVFLGRADTQLKVRGFRVEPGEIEAALVRHPGIAQAAVIGREDAFGHQRLVAYYVAESSAVALDGTGLEAFLAGHLPAYMVPAQYVKLYALPTTPSGKIDRRALPAPDASWAELDLDAEFVAARTSSEQLLSAIWAELLDLDVVGVHDSFFEIGGHSLLATQLVVRVSEAFQVEIPLTRFFEQPTVEALAKLIEDIQWASASPPELEELAPDREVGEI